MDCENVRRLLPAYGDNELSVERALDVERHLQDCTRCRAAVQRQREFSATVHRLYPRAPLPPGVEERVRRALRPRLRQPTWVHTLALAASAVLVVAAVFELARPRVSTTPATVLAAADLHRTAPESLPLAIRSSDVARVNAWLTQALPFPVNDPVQPPGDLTLEGAATADLAGERVGYLHYRRGDRAISLFLLRQRPWPAQGERVQVRAVEFRVFHLGGLNAVAWNHAPLSYVLVSDLAGRGSQACAVCHSVGGAGFTFPDGDQI